MSLLTKKIQNKKQTHTHKQNLISKQNKIHTVDRKLIQMNHHCQKLTVNLKYIHCYKKKHHKQPAEFRDANKPVIKIGFNPITIPTINFVIFN